MFSNQATVITSMSHLRVPWCRIVLTFVEVDRDYLQWHPKTWITNQEVITIKGWWTRIPPCLRWGSLPRSPLQVECVNLPLNSPHMLMTSRKRQAMVQRTIMIYTRTQMRMIIHSLPRKLLCRTALLEVVQRLTISVLLPKWTKTVPLRRCQTSTHLMIWEWTQVHQIWLSAPHVAGNSMRKLWRDIRKSVWKFSKRRERSLMLLSRGKPLMRVGKVWRVKDSVVGVDLIVDQNPVTTSQRCQQSSSQKELPTHLVRRYRNGSYRACSLGRL